MRDEEKSRQEFFSELDRLHEKLARLEEELRDKSERLEEATAALKVLVRYREEDRRDFSKAVLTNVKHLIEPCLERLKAGRLSSDQAAWLGILEGRLGELADAYGRRLLLDPVGLTPTELQVASLVRDGKSTKQIAAFLCISEKTVSMHRTNIRSKLGLQGRGDNLRAHLTRLS